MDLLGNAQMHYGATRVGLSLALRLAPLLCYMVGARRMSTRSRLGAALSLAAAACLASHYQVERYLVVSALGLIYYVACSIVTHWAAGFWPRESSGMRVVLFFWCVVAYLLLPTLAFHEAARATFLILGWDLALKSYSYCVERRPTEGSWSNCLNFMLVSPLLVYQARPVPAGRPRIDPRMLARCGLGLSAMLLAALFLRPLYSALHPRSGQLELGLSTWLAFGVVRVLAEYASHSGLAHIQIGWLAQLGVSLPERYRFPLAARDPLDFWRRWNTYVGSWLWRYVFVPSARRAARARGMRANWAAWAITMLASGALHDGYVLLKSGTTDLLYFKFFALMLLSIVAVDLSKRVRPDATATRNTTLAWSIAARASVGLTLVGGAALWG